MKLMPLIVTMLHLRAIVYLKKIQYKAWKSFWVAVQKQSRNSKTNTGYCYWPWFLHRLIDKTPSLKIPLTSEIGLGEIKPVLTWKQPHWALDFCIIRMCYASYQGRNAINSLTQLWSLWTTTMASKEGHPQSTLVAALISWV